MLVSLRKCDVLVTATLYINTVSDDVSHSISLAIPSFGQHINDKDKMETFY